MQDRARQLCAETAQISTESLNHTLRRHHWLFMFEFVFKAPDDEDLISK